MGGHYQPPCACVLSKKECGDDNMNSRRNYAPAAVDRINNSASMKGHKKQDRPIFYLNQYSKNQKHNILLL